MHNLIRNILNKTQGHLFPVMWKDLPKSVKNIHEYRLKNKLFIFLPFKFNFLQTIAFLNWKNLKELNSLKHNLWDMDKQWNIYVHMKYNSIQFENDDLYFSNFRGLLENIYCYDIIKVWILWFICIKKSSEIIIYTIENLFQKFKQIN